MADCVDSNDCPSDPITAETLRYYHGVPLSEHYFYQFNNDVSGKTEYVTITNRGNLQLVNGDFVSDALFENSRVYAFLE
jgi:hypothetical protein